MGFGTAGATTFADELTDGIGTECRRAVSNGLGDGVSGARTGVGAGGTARGVAGVMGFAAGGAGKGRTVACSSARASWVGGRKGAGHSSRTWSNREARMA